MNPWKKQHLSLDHINRLSAPITVNLNTIRYHYARSLNTKCPHVLRLILRSGIYTSRMIEVAHLIKPQSQSFLPFLLSEAPRFEHTTGSFDIRNIQPTTNLYDFMIPQVPHALQMHNLEILPTYKPLDIFTLENIENMQFRSSPIERMCIHILRPLGHQRHIRPQFRQSLD